MSGVEAVERDESGLVEKMSLDEMNRRLQHGWRSAKEEIMCPRCAEVRMVLLTTIHGKTSAFCQVCAKDWEL